VIYDVNIDAAGGDLRCCSLYPAREFLTPGKLRSLAVSEPAPAPADNDHYRENG
jgi:hypothetical protein